MTESSEYSQKGVIELIEQCFNNVEDDQDILRAEIRQFRRSQDGSEGREEKINKLLRVAKDTLKDLKDQLGMMKKEVTLDAEGKRVFQHFKKEFRKKLEDYMRQKRIFRTVVEEAKRKDPIIDEKDSLSGTDLSRNRQRELDLLERQNDSLDKILKKAKKLDSLVQQSSEISMFDFEVHESLQKKMENNIEETTEIMTNKNAKKQLIEDLVILSKVENPSDEKQTSAENLENE